MCHSSPAAACEAERRITAICRGAEAAEVQQHLVSSLDDPAQASVLWLTWVQWRALGRDVLSRETELSPWAVAERLRQLKEIGVPVLSSSEERELIARGRFHLD